MPSLGVKRLAKLLAAAAVAVVLCAPSVATAQPPSIEERFIAGLRQRRLFELAEKHCQTELADQGLPPVQRAELTIELIRTLAQHAAFARPEDRSALWQQARATAAEFLASHGKNPRLILVRFQDALTPLSEGELARQELEAGALSAEGVDAAKAAVRQSLRLLEKLDDELEGEIPLQRRIDPKADELSGDELAALQRHVKHQRARGLKNQALLYDAGSADRISALGQAKETLEAALIQAADHPLQQAHLRLELAICQRLLGELELCRAELSQLASIEMPPELQLAARAEAIRLALAENQLAQAQKTVEEGRLIDGQSAAELDLATLELCLAQLTAATSKNDQSASAKWQKLAAQQARLLEDEHGAYWGRRADQLLVRSLPAGAGGNAELLARTADSLYLKGEFEQALAAYDQAAAKAIESGDDKQALEVAFKAALVQEQRKLHRQAAERFCALAVRHKEQAPAAAAHLRGIWNAAQEVRRDESYAKDYARLLVELLDTWPRSAAADQARIWQGRLLASKGQWRESAAAYMEVPADSEHFEAAVSAAIDALQHDLSSRPPGQPEKADASHRAVSYLRSVVLGGENKLPERWSQPQRAAALAAAEIILEHLPNEAAQAEELLQAALADVERASAEWTSAAKAQHILALASQPAKRGQAITSLEELSESSPAALLELLEGLSAAGATMRSDARRELAALELATAKLLESRRDQLDSSGRLALDRITAQALAAADRREEALALYARLAKENPSDGGIQEGYGDLLLAAADEPTWKRALSQWRIVAARSKPRTERWFKAKYSVALSQHKLGDSEAAADLLEYLLVTPPGLNGTAWKAKCQALLDECRRQR